MNMIKAYSVLTSRMAKAVDIILVAISIVANVVTAIFASNNDILLGFVSSIVFSIDAYIVLYMDYFKFNGTVARKSRSMLFLRNSLYGREVVLKALKFDLIYTFVQCLLIGFGSAIPYLAIYKDVLIFIGMGIGIMLIFYVLILVERIVARRYELNTQTAMIPMFIFGMILSFTNVPWILLQDRFVGNTKAIVIEFCVEGLVIIGTVALSVFAMRSFKKGFDSATHDIRTKED